MQQLKEMNIGNFSRWALKWNLPERRLLKNLSKEPSSWRQLPVNMGQKANPVGYFFFKNRRAVTNDQADFNLLLYRFRPSPIYRKQKPFGGKCNRCSD